MISEGVRPTPTSEYGSYNGEPFLPPSVRGVIGPDQFRDDYPFRYELWESLRTGRNPFEVSPVVIERRLSTLNHLDRYISLQRIAGRDRILREKQLSVFVDTRDFLEQGNTEGFVEAPTGFGKTVLFSEIIRATDQKTVVVVPTQLLVEQTFKRFKTMNPSLDVGRVYANKKERNSKVIITTYQSLVTSNGGVNPEDVGLLVLDEVHQSLTDARINAVGRFKNAIKLGFTATPEYTKDKRVEKLLNNEIHTISLREAVETGLLSPFSVYLAETNIDISNVKLNRSGDYDEKDLEEAIDIYARNKSAVDFYKQIVDQKPDLAKAVAYCISVKHAREVAQLFNESGIRAAAVWADQDPKERSATMDAYRMGEIKVLTNVNILTEGFDDPEAALCLNLRPTLSNVVAKQRGGRVLRLDPENPSKHAVVVDFMDRNENRRNLQITFAQVAGGAEIFNKTIVEPLEPTIPWFEEGGQQVDGRTREPVDIPTFALENLNVITNAEEVLSIISEMESMSDANLSEVQENDFPITYEGLADHFTGRLSKLMIHARFVLAGIAADSPDLFANRRSGTNIVRVATDKELFIREMVKVGALKKENAEIKTDDFPVTYASVKENFSGDRSKIFLMISEVLQRLREENSGLVVQRRSGTTIIDVVIDRQRFIDEMKKEGAVLKSEKPQKVQETDFLISNSNLTKNFIGHYKILQPIAQEILSELSETSDLVQKRDVGARLVDVVTDRERFIREMQNRGIIAKGEDMLPVQDQDFVVAYDNLKATFIGDSTRLSQVSRDVLKEIESQNPQLKTRRKNGRIISVVVTDKNLFIQKMLDRGYQLKEDSLSNVKDSDFPITAKNLTSKFVGDYKKIGQIADQVINEIRDQFPDLVVTRVRRASRLTAVSDYDLFVQRMVEKGAKLRES